MKSKVIISRPLFNDAQRVAILLIVYLFVTGTEAICQDSPGPSGEQTEFQPGLGIYTYSVKWGQTPAAKATVTLSREGEFYRIVAHTETTNSISWIYKLKYRGESVLNANDLKPIKTELYQETRRRKRRTEITYDDSGEIKTKVTKSKKKKQPTTEEKTFKPEGEVFDVFSAVFLAKRFNWELGETQEFDVFTGKKRHIIKLICTDKAIVEEGEYQLDAWVIRPSVIDPEKPNEKPKLTNTKLYLSADEYRDLLKIKSKGKFGTIRVKIKSYTPVE